MKFKSKIFLTLLIFIVFLININCVYGFSISHNGNTYDLPSFSRTAGYPYLCVVLTNGSFQLYESTVPIEVKDGSGNTKVLTVMEGTANVYKCNSDNTSWDFLLSFSNSGGDYSKGVNIGTSNAGMIIDANHDIKYINSDNVFFQSPVTDNTVIPALETAEEVPKAMIQTLTIMIPIGLIVLGIGLTIYLIKRVKFFQY